MFATIISFWLLLIRSVVVHLYSPNINGGSPVLVMISSCIVCTGTWVAVGFALLLPYCGLFTDGFAAFDPLNEVGIARRINLNVLVDPANGGDLWKLRDGLNAVTQGSVGDATQLNRLADALTAPVVPASGSFVGAARTTSALAADVLSQISGGRQRAEQTEVYATARQDALTALQMQDGVDTDQEMQTLLIVEQAYAANARVLQTADELIQTLIGL